MKGLSGRKLSFIGLAAITVIIAIVVAEAA